MRIFCRLSCLCLLAALATSVGAAVPTVRADLLFVNGNVRTLDPARPQASAVAVAAGRILRVGTDAEVRVMAGSDARIVDLHGHTLLPGLGDTHVHPAIGEYFNRRLCNVAGYTLEENFTRLARCAATAPAGDWVVAYGWYFTDNPHLSEVSLAQLDAAVPERKLLLIARDSHTVWVNSKTLAAYGITADTADPDGGSIGRDPVTKAPNGVLRDAAAWRVLLDVQHHSAYSVSTAELFLTAIPYLNSLGITSLFEALGDDDIEAAYQALDRAGQLSMHVSIGFAVAPDTYRKMIPKIAGKRAHQTPHVTVNFVKVIADGNGEDNLANILPGKGRPPMATHGYYTQPQMNELVRLAEANGLSVYVHVIGDGTARQVIDAVAEARRHGPCPRCRHTLTHLQWIDPADMVRMKELHMIANLQEGWLAPRAIGGPAGYDYLKDTASGPMGPTLAAAMYPFRSLHEAGVPIAAGSDWFYTDENPWNDMEVGATSRDPGDAASTPMVPAQTLDVATLLAARTRVAAYQLFLEQSTGTIAVGKRADLVVVDRDVLAVPPSTLHETRVLMTVFNGRVVHELPAAH